MPADEADAYLIAAVQRGESDAWRGLIERFQGRLLSFARKRLADTAEAEDIVQETFLGLMRSLPSYDSGRSLESYLFAILRNKLNDYFRRTPRGQRESLDTIDPAEGGSRWVGGDSPSARLAHDETLAAQRGALVRCLRSWVEQCSEQGRFQELMVIEMLVVLGLRNKEVASDLGLAETAVAGIKFRVLEKWRQLALAADVHHEWGDEDLSSESTVGQVWREEGVSCLKRSTLGRYLLGVLSEDWCTWAEFHVQGGACDRCLANLDDLRSEDERDRAAHEQLRERCFASSVGFLSARPPG